MTFINNSAGTAGGGIYLENAITYVGIIASTFINNHAVTGNGGAIFVGPSCQYISLGGPIPIFQTCFQCGNGGLGKAHKGDRENYLTYQIVRNSDYLVKGYLVTFPTTSDKVATYCTDWIKVKEQHRLITFLYYHILSSWHNLS